MPSPFPGMDPYLESPAYWPGFHTRFVVALSDAIVTALPPGYYAEVEQHVWLEDEPGDDRHPFAIPDTYVADDGTDGSGTATLTRKKTKAVSAATTEVLLPKLKKRPHKYVAIVDQPGNRVVTVIELLSPSNKTGEDRDQYLLKRAEFFATKVNLVELDLLRDGERMPFGKPKPPKADYYALVGRGDHFPKASVWAWTVRDPCPVLPVPLKPADGDIELDLKPCFDHTFDGAGYRTRLRYDQSPDSPLRVADAEWATEKVLPKG